MRVLVWNIKQFTLRRVNDATGATVQERAANAERTLANTMYIVSTVEEANADIFVVIEARTSQGPVAQLAGGDGAQGLIYLLGQLREWNSAQWMLVPPIRANPQQPLGGPTHTETVGVFWRDDRLQFTGPFRWPGGAANATGPPIPPPGPGAAYPAPWNATVPVGTTAAAWCRFYDGAQEILFEDYLHRRPYLTIFAERNPPGRTINLFSVHFKPGVTPRTASSRLVGLMGRPPAGSLNLAVGDFNIDLIAPSGLQAAALDLWGPSFANYTRVTPNPPAPTMIQERGDALPGAYTVPKCLDYGFVRYATGMAPPVGQGPVAGIANRVASTPAAPPLPAFTRDMSQSLATIAAIADAGEQRDVFRSRWNYGHISPPDAGTSDHLPVLLQV
jgi:hypothetical protein